MIDGTALGWAWLILAAVLGIAELLAPGVFLVFIAIAAALTGVSALALPDLTPSLQLLVFALWSAVTILIGKRWYRDYPVETSDPLLNDRVARLIGETVVVVQPIEEGRGRVRIGDSEWLARGSDMAAGTKAIVTGCQDTTLTVKPLPLPLPPAVAEGEAG